MNFAQLRAFYAVAQHGTFSAAAQALSVSQPAVTQHVRALEEAIGNRLFHRRGSGVELTPDGVDLLPHIHQIIKGLEDVAARIEGGKELRTGHLTVGLCSPHVAMPLIRRFRMTRPGIHIDTRMSNTGTLLDLVSQQRVDVAVVTLTEPRDDLYCHRLVGQEVLVVVPVDHRWSGREAIGIDELQDQPFILREAGSMTRQIFERALADKNIRIRPELVLASREAVKEAVANDLGLGIVLDKELGNDERLVGLRIAGASVAANEYLIAHPEVSDLGAVREFISSAQHGPTDELVE
ncbi:aminoethylphosphonate catabolism LysR family transcriptional regulator [Rhizobium sp. BK512]|uniref:LysR substrate-binding domain-containing protein n=1 Tax=Rhizobium sp. BK512 TaxID=2587010 RepID=UPI000DDED091|nr:LysR substrate-binding domain-containing protein [Rhizobium sp. BK512]MBB3565000.1 aminoethylphosphonate catabolism LysR family transcriptional regulator [Rhizobium sp. BK512]